MLKNFLYVLICAICSVGIACTSTEDANLNSSTSANVPPGFSTNSVPPSGDSTPGIPDANSLNANNVTKGTTPTPGIPDPKEIGKPLPKGATPTPGIPDPETLKKQANTVVRDMNMVNNPSNANSSVKEKPQNDRKKMNPPSQK